MAAPIRDGLKILLALLLLWNIVFPIFWIGLCEARAVTRASNIHGHVEDYEERIGLMRREMDVDTAKSRPYYPAVVIFGAVNAALAVAALRSRTA
jgi:hypothetical protein